MMLDIGSVLSNTVENGFTKQQRCAQLDRSVDVLREPVTKITVDFSIPQWLSPARASNYRMYARLWIGLVCYDRIPIRRFLLPDRCFHRTFLHSVLQQPKSVESPDKAASAYDDRHFRLGKHNRQQPPDADASQSNTRWYL